MSNINSRKYQNFYQAFQDALSETGKSQAYVCRALNKDSGQVSRWYTGENTPYKRTIKSIGGALGVRFYQDDSGLFSYEILTSQPDDADNLNNIDAKIKRYVDRAESEGISDTERVLLLEYLQGRAESLSKELAEFGRIVERLKLMMKDNDPDSSDS